MSFRPALSLKFGSRLDRSAAQRRLRRFALLAGCGALFSASAALADPTTDAAPSPAPAPSFAGPLAPNPHPLVVDAGPFGNVTVTGQVSGLAIAQSHPTQIDGTVTSTTAADISNAQVEVQTTTGPIQLYAQAGLYTIPALGTPYLRSGKAQDQLFGPLSVAYAKANLSKDVSISAGFLPTLIGLESTFTFQNMNVQRGLLWNQEPAINRGAQINYAHGKLSAALSLNDGFYSGKFNWLSGTLSYAVDSANTLTFIGGGNFSSSRRNSYATPLAQNNSSIFNIIYTYNKGPLTVSPYVQYTHVGRDDQLGIFNSAETIGGAVLAKYTLANGFSLAARGEYLKSSGNDSTVPVFGATTNLLYGLHSSAWSATLTPTYQKGIFFARGELSYTRIAKLSDGFGFGADGNKRGQVRGLFETGFLF